MASRPLYPVKDLGHGRVRISGSFAPAGAGAPTSATGPGYAVTRTGVGTFLITLQDAYNALESATATVRLAAAADTQAQFGAYSDTAKTLVIRTLTAGVAADIAADANNVVCFDLVMRNSSIR